MCESIPEKYSARREHASNHSNRFVCGLVVRAPGIQDNQRVHPHHSRHRSDSPSGSHVQAMTRLVAQASISLSVFVFCFGLGLAGVLE
jgi:hypothetical protein